MDNPTENTMTTKDAYDHVGETYRYFLGWRHKLFAGYLTVLAAIALYLRSEEDAQCRARGEILTEVIVHFYEFAIYCRAIGQKPSQFTLEAFGIQQAERKG